MSWIVKKLAGAMISGIGWKLGSDVYEELKKRIAPPTVDEGAAADEVDGEGVVDVDPSTPRLRVEVRRSVPTAASGVENR